MNMNVGGVDKAARVLVGVGLIGLAVTEQIGPWGYFGVVPLLTGFSGRCPAYSVLKINTCSLKAKNHH